MHTEVHLIKDFEFNFKSLISTRRFDHDMIVSHYLEDVAVLGLISRRDDRT